LDPIESPKMKNSPLIDYPAVYADMVAQALKNMAAVRVAFTGKSMTPALREGMQILVEKAPSEKIRLADIIMYRKATGAVVHRVVGIIRRESGRVFVTKGDNHAYVESDRIPDCDLVGRVGAAYFEREPDIDVLVRSRAVGASYVVLANLASGVMCLRKFIPAPVRNVLKYFAGAFFFMFKNFIHAVYLGIYHVQLPGRRRAGAF